MPGWPVSDGNWDGIGMRLETVGKYMERNWRICWGWSGLEGDGSNALSRGECQAGGTDDALYMVFAIKTRKYGLKNDFRIENCWLYRKNRKRC